MIYLIVILYLNFLSTLSSSLSSTEQYINEEFVNVKNLSNFNLYKSLSLEENRSSIAWSRLHSTQLNTTLLNKMFKITNKTIVSISKETNREMLCKSIKSCHLSTNTYQCILDLNMIIYLNPSINTTSHFNQIKLFKLNVILSDFTNDYLTFDKLAYEFVFNLNIEYGDVHEFGSVKASTSNENFDLNNLIKYYIDFNTNDRIDLIDLIKIDETTGSLLINRTKLITKLYKSKYEFYVDAFIQCSSNQKQLQNRTLISLYLINDKQTKPSVNMINLVESVTLNSIECLKIKKDFSSQTSSFTSIALAQIQIDNFYELNNLKFEYENQLINHLDNNYYSIKFEHLIDNIYIIYLIINNSSIQENYLIDIKKFHFKISNLKFSFKSQIYVCLNVQTDQELFEELSLVQFRQNYLILNSQTNEFTLNADYLSASTKLNFILDPTIDSKHIILSDQTNNSVKVKLENLLFHKKNNIELLQNEIIVLAYDSNIPDGRFSKIYTYLKQMSLTHKSSLKFASKIIFNNHIEQLEVFKPNQHEFKFNLFKNKLINNSIIGYLPNIHELVQLYENRVENYYYKFSQEQECFKLTKFDGVLYYKQCLNLNNTIRLDIDLVNSKDEKLTLKNIYQIEINLNTTIDEQEKQVINLYTNETRLDLTLSYELNLNVLNGKTNLPKYLKLANIISENENKKFSLLTAEHNLNEQFKHLIILDTKSNQIYLNITNFYEQTPTILFNKCINFQLDSKNFQYINSIKRILKSNQIYDLNFCLFINKYQTELIRPVIGSHYEYLVKNQSTLNISFLWLGFICLFLASAIFLISTAAYLCYKKKLNSKISSQNNDDKSSSFARFEVSSKYSSSLDSFSQTSQCELKIRNDENTDSELYQVFSYNYDERVVPTKLDILLNKKPLSAENSQFVELSSIKESSEDQGVYCLATGTSFTSHFSSVSNSECVDLDEHDDLSMNKCFKLNNIKHNDQNDVGKIEKTRLSLFEMTPFKVRQCAADYEVRQIFASNEYLIKNWIQTNSNNLSFQTSSSVSATNECII